jgi:hypothetical protein
MTVVPVDKGSRREDVEECRFAWDGQGTVERGAVGEEKGVVVRLQGREVDLYGERGGEEVRDEGCGTGGRRGGGKDAADLDVAEVAEPRVPRAFLKLVLAILADTDVSSGVKSVEREPITLTSG